MQAPVIGIWKNDENSKQIYLYMAVVFWSTPAM